MAGMPRHGRRRHRPDRYKVHRARTRGRMVAMVVLASVGLALLIASMELLLGERGGTAPDDPAPIPGLPGPRR